MKRSAENALLRSEYKVAFLQKTATSTQDSEAGSDTTTTTTTASIDPPIFTENIETKKLLITSSLCDIFFRDVCYSIAIDVFPEDILQDEAKRRFLCGAAYSAFTVLLCVEGVHNDFQLSTLFSLLVWIMEMALAAFFDANERNDVHSGHFRALRSVVKSVAYQAHSISEPPEIQKVARSLARKLENNDSINIKELENELFESAERVIASSSSIEFVLNSGCRRGCFLFPAKQHQHYRETQQPRHREIRVTPGRR